MHDSGVNGDKKCIGLLAGYEIETLTEPENDERQLTVHDLYKCRRATRSVEKRHLQSAYQDPRIIMIGIDFWRALPPSIMPFKKSFLPHY